MIFEFLGRTVFARKLVVDERTIEDDALFALEVPRALLLLAGDNSQTTVECAFLPPDFAFYYQLVAILFIQNIFNAVLGALMYKIVIEPQQRKTLLREGNDNKQDDRREEEGTTGVSSAAFLFALGVALPCVVVEPIYVLRALEIENVGLIMVFLATPIVNSLLILEAISGFAPVFARKNLKNCVLYFSCVFGMEFDDEQPRRVTREFLWKRVATLARDFAIVSVVLCVLKPFGYEFFPINVGVDSLDHRFGDLFSWRHLGNNFLVACLISASLSQSSLGVSLVYNIFYGVQTYEVVLNPMFRSRSPSEFWGKRWNVLVHKRLKNGVYKPTRKHITSSKTWAVVATFAVSGIIHEYVNFVLFNKPTGSQWKQMMFFGWNGVLIVLEHSIGHWAIFRYLSKTLPPIVLTALVLCSALPLAHLFTGDWIKGGYFDAVYIAEPVIVCNSRRG